MLKAMMVGAMLTLATAQAMAAAPFDQLFLRSEAQGSAYELHIAQLAAARASRAEVRAYAATLVNDHEAYNGALRDLAQAKGVALTSTLADKAKHQATRLGSLRGSAFDAAFLREAQRINAEDIRSFRQEASRTADPEIRDFVTRFLEVDEKHASAAAALASRRTASRMPVIQPPATGSSMPVVNPPGGANMPIIQLPGTSPTPPTQK